MPRMATHTDVPCTIEVGNLLTEMVVNSVRRTLKRTLR